MTARPYHLLFICTGNICRSPMAGGMAIHYARERGWPVGVKSASMLGLENQPADPKAVRAMREIDIDITRHRSQPITDELVTWSDYILVMELRHQMHLHSVHPHSEGKVLMLGNFGGLHEVRDPIGGWMFRFRRSREELLRCVRGFMDHLPPPREDDPGEDGPRQRRTQATDRPE